MTTANNYMSGMAQQNARLNKDQKALADAAAQGTNSGGMDATDVAVQAARLKDNVQFAGHGLNLGNKLLGTGKNLVNVGKGGILAPLTIADYGVSALTEDGSGLYENIGRFGGKVIGESIYGDGSQPALNEQELQAIKDGKNPLKPIYEDNSFPVPIMNPMSGMPFSGVVRPPSIETRTPVDFEPMELSNAVKEENRKSEIGSQFEGSALMPDGSTKGYLTDGTSRTMTPEEISAFENVRKTGEYTGVPMGEYQNVPDTQGSVQLPAGQSVPMSQDQYIKQYSDLQNAARDSVFKDESFRDQAQKNLQNQYFGQERFQQPTETPSAPQTSSGLSPLADEMLTEYAEFVESGEPMTADKQAYFETMGGMTGRTFDANDGGYSNKFNPQIMENFQRRVDEGVIDTSGLGRDEFQKFANTDRRNSLQMATDEIKARQAESTANYEANRPTIAGGSTAARTLEFQDRNQNGIEDREEGIAFDRNPNRMREEFAQVVNDFNIPDIRVGGQMVDATKENRALRDQENAIKQEAEELGLSPSATRAYVADKMRERSEAQQDRATRARIDELNIQNTQEGMASRRFRDQLALQSANKIETPTISASALTSVQKFLDANGVQYDPETGALTSRDERFLLPDGKVDLSPNSPLVALLRGTYTGTPVEGAEAFLAPPPSVASQMDNILEGGGVFSSDGRFYVKRDGKLVQQAAPKSY